MLCVVQDWIYVYKYVWRYTACVYGSDSLSHPCWTFQKYPSIFSNSVKYYYSGKEILLHCYSSSFVVSEFIGNLDCFLYGELILWRSKCLKTPYDAYKMHFEPFGGSVKMKDSIKSVYLNNVPKNPGGFCHIIFAYTRNNCTQPFFFSAECLFQKLSSSS